MTEPMETNDARTLGFMHGQDLTVNALYEGVTPNDAEEAVYDTVDSFRSYSPFEFYAAAMNASEYPDETWEAYEEGFHAGIMQALEDWEE